MTFSAHPRSLASCLGLAISLACSPVRAQTVIPVSISSAAKSGVGGDLGQMSADGRYSVFSSERTLIPSQNVVNAVEDIYLLDRETGAISLVSHSVSGNETSAAGRSTSPSISADGGWVVFLSRASDLTIGVTPSSPNTFLYERATGQIALVSHAFGQLTTGANRGSGAPSISADGSWITFTSEATNLIANFDDINPEADLYLFEPATGQITLISHAWFSPNRSGSIESFGPALIAPDGEFVAYSSRARNLVPGFSDGNGPARDVFLWRRTTDSHTLVSHLATNPAVGGNADSRQPSMTTDGEFIVFDSGATDLLGGFVGGAESVRDVFLFERATGSVSLISHAMGAPLVGGDRSSAAPRISANGAFVAFESAARDLVGSFVDGNGASDVFLWQRATDATTVVSHASGNPLSGGDGESFAPTIDADGTAVAFGSLASDLVPGFVDRNSVAEADIYAFERATANNTLVSRSSGSVAMGGDGASGPPSISANGVFIAYESNAQDLVANASAGADLPNALIFDRRSADNQYMTTTSLGVQPDTADDLSTLFGVDGGSPSPRSISDDGRFVVFVSYASDIVPRQTGAVGESTVFVYDRKFASVRIVSHAAGSELMVGNDASRSPRISGDGQFVVFESNATDLVAGFVNANGAAPDIFFWQASTGQISLVSHATSGAVVSANRASEVPAIDSQARYIAFRSRSTDLVPGFVNRNGAGHDVFLFDRLTGVNSLLSGAGGSTTFGGDGLSFEAMVSRDGAFIAYESQSTDLLNGFVDGNGNGAGLTDLYLIERATGTLRLISHVPSSASQGGNHLSKGAVLSSDGAFVVFESRASDLISGFVDGDGTGAGDVYLYETASEVLTLISHAADQPMVGGERGGSIPDGISDDGNLIAFASREKNLIAGLIDRNGRGRDLFLYERATDSTTLLSHRFGAPLETANNPSAVASISGDGVVVAFWSRATDLLDGFPGPFPGPGHFNVSNVYRFDRSTGLRSLVSRDAFDPLMGSRGPSGAPRISHDGGSIAFTGSAANLVTLDLNDTFDVFLSGPDLAADLQLLLAAAPNPALPLGLIDLMVNVANNGPGTASRPRILIELGAGAALQAVTAAGWQCSSSSTAVACQLQAAHAPLTRAPTIGISIVAPPFIGTFTVHATARTGVGDPVPGNEQAEAVITISGASDPAIAKTASPAMAIPERGSNIRPRP